MKKKTQLDLQHSKKSIFNGILLIGLLFISPTMTVTPATAAAENASRPEMTPGPRMIRAVEALANDYLKSAEALRLTSEQMAAIRDEASAFKKNIWRKEAVLIGMFDKIGLKRRHGLLSKGDYAATNQLTGVLETEETARMMKAITQLQTVLSPEQKQIFQGLRSPELDLKHPEGFNTQIGLLALGPYRRAYGQHRIALGLSDEQKVSLQKALTVARREVIEIGTQIEISRMEAYDLLKEPLINPKQVMAAMVRTGILEGHFFPKLGEYSKNLKNILTHKQQLLLKRLGRGKGRVRMHHGERSGVKGVASHDSNKAASLLDRAKRVGLSRTQTKALVELEISAMQDLSAKQVERKIAKLELDALIEGSAASREIETKIDQLVRLIADIKNIEFRKRAAGLKIFNGHQKLSFHTPSADYR